MSQLKQYLLFAGENYYPSGGWDDFQGSYDTLDEAKIAGEMSIDGSCDWAHIVNSFDLDSMSIIWMSPGKYWS